MHLLVILLGFGIAWLLRLSWSHIPHHPMGNGSIGIIMMIAPPLFVLMTCLSIIWMGPYGMEIPLWEGWLSYTVSLAFLGYAIAVGIKLTIQNYRFMRHVRTLPTESIQGYTCRILETDRFYSAQCGWGDSELVISRGLVQSLKAKHLNAIFAHEEGHKYFHDIVHYSILHWFKTILPFFAYSDSIWRYLIIVRELRADQWATQTVDPLDLAEALVLVARSPQLKLSKVHPLLTGDLNYSGLSLRVKALTTPEYGTHPPVDVALWLWIIIACCPLLLVPFHH